MAARVGDVLSEENIQDHCAIDVTELTYSLGRTTIIHRRDGRSLPAWQAGLFAMMERKAVQVGDYLRLPSDQVVEIGRQIGI